MDRCKECSEPLLDYNIHPTYRRHCKQCGQAKLDRGRDVESRIKSTYSFFLLEPENVEGICVCDNDIWVPPADTPVNYSQQPISKEQLQQRLATEQAHDPSCIVAHKLTKPLWNKIEP